MAANLADLQEALVNADAAGDQDAARTLAAEITRVQGTPAASQADVRRVDNSMLPKRPPRVIPGDMGSLLSAGEAFNAGNKALEHAAYEGGGMVTDKTGSPAAGAFALGAAHAVPYVLGGFGGGKAAIDLVKGAGERMMQIALKPSKAARESGDAVKAVRTLLEEGANVTEGGAAKLTEKINALDDQLGELIKDSKAKLLNTDVLQYLRGIMKDYEAGTLGAKNLDKIREVANAFLKHSAFRGGDEMTVQAAQAMKRQNYAELGDAAFGTGLRPATERDALKGITRGLKEGIERVAPETGPINAQMSPLINARDLALERTSAAHNNNLGGIGLLNPKTLLLSLADRSPLVASLLARLLHSGVAPAAPAIGAAAGGGMGAIIGAQGAREP